MNELQFIDALEKKGIMLNETQIKQFRLYYETLIEWNQKMNLTAITKKEEVYLKHFYDSITPAFDFTFNSQTIIDVGAGAGFPSIPLKIIYPDLKITIVDSLNKRITFLHHLFMVLGFSKVDAVAMRAEDYAKEHFEQADIVMARAVARLSILNELCLPLVKVGGCFIALKGKNALEEVTECKKGITILGGKIIKESSFTLSDDNDYRFNLLIQKINHTPKKYPRHFSKIKKQPIR